MLNDWYLYSCYSDVKCHYFFIVSNSPSIYMPIYVIKLSVSQHFLQHEILIEFEMEFETQILTWIITENIVWNICEQTGIVTDFIT